MAFGTKDARGIYQFGEDDAEATFSQLLNKGMQSVSDATKYFSGTPAQRAAMNPAPDGARWKDTDTAGLEWIGVAGAWAPSASLLLPPLGSGFSATGAGDEVSITRSADGICVLTGRVVRSSGSSMTVLTIADAKYRPKRSVFGSVSALGGAGADGTRFQLALTPAGVLGLTPYSGSPAWGTSTWIPLNLSWAS